MTSASRERVRTRLPAPVARRRDLPLIETPPAALPQKQAIDRGPPDLETLRDLVGPQALGLEGGDLGGVDRGWAALVNDPAPRGADPFMAEPMRGSLGHWFTPPRSRYRSLRCPSHRRRACPRGPNFCSLRPLTTTDLETRSFVANAAFSGTVVSELSGVRSGRACRSGRAARAIAGQHFGGGTSPSPRSSRPGSVDRPALIGIPEKLGLLVRPSPQGETIRLVANARRKEIGYNPLGSVAEVIDVLIVNFGRRGIRNQVVCNHVVPQPLCAVKQVVLE